MKTQLKSATGFVIFLSMCLGAQLTGSLLTIPAIRSGWYHTLIKPFFTPPDRIFGPVWTVLYFTLAVAAWLVWRKESEDLPVRPALLLFFVQLILNVIWSAFFFSLRRPGLALVEIILMWFLILFTVFVFTRVNRWAGLLLIPYLVWVLYAALLNGAIWWLNHNLPSPEGRLLT